MSPPRESPSPLQRKHSAFTREGREVRRNGPDSRLRGSHGYPRRALGAEGLSSSTLRASLGDSWGSERAPRSGQHRRFGGEFMDLGSSLASRPGVGGAFIYLVGVTGRTVLSPTPHQVHDEAQHFRGDGLQGASREVIELK